MVFLNLPTRSCQVISMEMELIRKTLGHSRDQTIFERVRRLNAELVRLGIQRPPDDHLVRKTFGKPRQAQR